MSSLLGSIRGTVQGVIGATDHLLWWVCWHAGASDVRPAPDRQTA
jgi:hypothetical protein